MSPLTRDSFLVKLDKVIDPATNEAKNGKGAKITLNLEDGAGVFGELAYWLGLDFPIRNRTVVVPLSSDDLIFGKALCQEISGAKILTTEELADFSKPKGTKVVFATRFLNDEIMNDVTLFVNLLKERKTVLVDYCIGTVINECERAQTLKVVNLFDRGDYLS
jgi:hypothetical protein